MSYWQIFFRIVRGLPLISGLPETRWINHKDAAKQLATNLVWSLLPIILGVLWLLAESGEHSNPDLSSVIFANIGHGELFLYCSSLLAPIYWMALHDPPGAGRFPSKLSHMVFVALIICASAFFYGLQRSNLTLNEGFIFQTSIILFVVSVLILYIATVYHAYRMPSLPEELLKKDERDFSSNYKNHR